MLNHNWTLILGCSRQLLAAIRRSIPDAGLDPTASESNRLYLSALRSEICGPADLVSFWITRDIRSDDGHVLEDEVDALLWLCYQDRPWVRVAAIRLWRCYHETLLPRVRAFVACPQFSEDELVEFERAIELLEKALDVLTIESAQDDSIAEAVFDGSTACPQDGSKELVTYSVSELCKEIGISRPTLNK